MVLGDLDQLLANLLIGLVGVPVGGLGANTPTKASEHRF